MRKLLQALWPSSFIRSVSEPWTLVFWFTPSKQSLHLPFQNLLEMDDSDEAWLAEYAGPSNIYYGLGLRAPGTEQQGGKNSIVALPGWFLDIDFYNPKAHKAHNLPHDLDEAAPLFDVGQDPSVIINSGNGVQAGFFFEEPLILDSPSRRTAAQKAFKKFQEPYIKRANELGWHLDNTASIQRVWRLPGFVNQKTGKPTELIYLDADERYKMEDLGSSMPQERSQQPEEDLEEWLKGRSKKQPKVSIGNKSESEEETEEEEESEEEEEYEDFDFEELRKSLSRIHPNQPSYKYAQAILKKESLAPKGQRDEALQKACSALAWLPLGRKADPEKLVKILIPSLKAWVDDEDATKTLEEEVEKAIDKIERSQIDYWERQRKERPKLESMMKALGVNPKKEPPEAEGGIANDAILSHSIITYKGGFYVYSFKNEDYSIRPLRGETEVVPFSRDHWGDIESLDVQYLNRKGEKKLKPLSQLLYEYSTPAMKAYIDLMVEKSRYDRETETFIEAGARKRVTEAQFIPIVDEWLKCLAGPLYDELVNWISYVVKLNKPNSVLYLDGESGAGKGLLATGLAYIWSSTGTPTPFEKILENFNEPLLECPLAWIDEGLEGKKNVTVELRNFVGRSSFWVNEKYLPRREARGHCRLIICANNRDVLRVGGAEFTYADLTAVTKRILHIKARKEAVEFLSDHGGWEFTTPWIEHDYIAKHALYLAQNRVFEEGDRFAVQGNETSLHRNLAIKGRDDLTYEWLARFATAPEKIEIAYRGKREEQQAFIRDGQIYINTQCVIDCWAQYMGDTLKPDHGKIGALLRNLSYRQVRLTHGGGRQRFWIVRTNMILEWCREHQIGNEDRIIENLKKVQYEIGEEETVNDDD